MIALDPGLGGGFMQPSLGFTVLDRRAHGLEPFVPAICIRRNRSVHEYLGAIFQAQPTHLDVGRRKLESLLTNAVHEVPTGT